MSTTTYADERQARGATCARCQQAQAESRAKCAATGLRNSEVIDHGEHWCAAQSIEAHPGTWGHPKVWIQIKGATA